MRTSRPLTVAVSVVALTACGSVSESGSAAGSTPVGQSVGRNSAAMPTRTPSPSPTGPRAKDGFNYRACKDGTCEVYVRTGSKVPVKRSAAGFSTLVVHRVSETCVDFSGGTASARVGAERQQPGFRSRLNGLAIVTVAVNQPLAILRLSPA
ncbi:hypothetical protein [Kribbella flavida]|nr:hypothetical protein [Kribbella flavida]